LGDLTVSQSVIGSPGKPIGLIWGLPSGPLGYLISQSGGSDGFLVVGWLIWYANPTDLTADQSILGFP
jgi:hypothetical protein